MKFEIRSWMTGNVLFSLETDSLKLTLQAAVKSGANLRGADLYGADLYGANLRGANLHDANLHGADLYGADLHGANLRGADLRGANLYGANLCGANLHDANLHDANLRGADLHDANLHDADLHDADLHDAKGLELFPIQVLGHKHFLQTTSDGRLRIGCQIHTFEEWIEIAEQMGGENGYEPLDIEIYKLHVQHIERVSKLLWNKKSEAVK